MKGCQVESCFYDRVWGHTTQSKTKLEHLKRFRNQLKKFPLGSTIVEYYYHSSSMLIYLTAKRPNLRRVISALFLIPAYVLL